MSIPNLACTESIALQRIDSGTRSAIATWDEPLAGLPSTVKVGNEKQTFGPHLLARRAAEAYCKSVCITIPFPKTYQKLNKVRARKISQLYEDLVSTRDANNQVNQSEAAD
jgi:hypothetical protein